MKPMDVQLVDAFQAQFNQERQNRDVYQDIEHDFILMGLSGFAAWAHEQAHEERHHARRMGYYLADKRGIKPEIRMTPLQSFLFTQPIEAFQYAADLEAHNTELIDNLYAKAEELDDNGACLFLHWFIREQESSTAQFKTWLDRISLIVDDGAGILAMDKEFSKEYGD